MAKDYVSTVVIGGGVTGLSAAFHSGGACLVLEKNGRAGGASRSKEREGILFDYIGHAVWMGDGYAQRMLADLLGDNLYFQSYQVAAPMGGSPDHLGPEWTAGESSSGEPDDGIRSALRESGMDARPYGHFLYPLYGGMQAAVDALAARAGEVRTRTRVTRIDVQRRAITVNGTTEIGYDRLITTMPLPELVNVIPDLPAGLREALTGLVHKPLYCVYLAMDRPARTKKHHLYYPDGMFVMRRVTVQSNLSPYAAPDGVSSYIVEIPHPPVPGLTGETLRDQAIADMVKARLIGPRDEILVAAIRAFDYAYPVPTTASAGLVAQVTDWLRQHDIHTAGRVGSWAPLSWGGALLAGRQVAQTAQTPLTPRGLVSVPVVPAKPPTRAGLEVGSPADGNPAEPERTVPAAGGPNGAGKP